MKRTLFSLGIILFVFMSSCQKEENNPETIVENEFLTEEENEIIVNLPDAEGYDIESIVLPNGELLSIFMEEYENSTLKSTNFSDDENWSNLMELMLIKVKTILGALEFTEREKFQYPDEGENKPKQYGLAYGWGNKNHTVRRSPSLSKSACEYKIYGLDCSGLVYQSFLKAGVELAKNGEISANAIRKGEKLKEAIEESYPELKKHFSIEDKGQISKEALRTADLVYWLSGSNPYHIGIVVQKVDGRFAVIQSNGTVNDCDLNLTKSRGPRIIEMDDENWFGSSTKWGITRMIESYSVVKTKDVSTKSKLKSSNTSITTGGEVIEQGASAVVARGVCWSTNRFPTIDDNKTVDGSGTGSFTSTITGLKPKTTYYIRSYATNNEGTSYGNMVTYTPEGNDGPAVDVDGYEYRTVVIGNQEWFAENLRTTKYNDGTLIPTGYSNDEWYCLNNAAYAVYPHTKLDGFNSDAEVLETYGALYNWYAVNTGKLCPTGWHMPTDDEWSEMENYLADNGYNYDGSIGGGREKIAKTLASESGWISSSKVGSVGNDDYPAYRNKSGFGALPGGFRYFNGSFLYMGVIGLWWSATEYNTNDAWYQDIFTLTAM